MGAVYIAGSAMTAFRRTPGRGIRELAVTAANGALDDAGISADAVQRIFFGNAAGATVTHQEMVRGEVAFRGSVLDGVSIINVENACASGSSALDLAHGLIAGGQADAILAVGAEQLTHDQKERSFRALRGASDIFEIGEAGADEDWTQSLLMTYYAEEAREFGDRTGATVEDFARVAVKNRAHAALNPDAQYRTPQTLEDVMGARLIADPLTLSMCSPMTDGGAAILLCSEAFARRHIDGPLVRVRGVELRGARAGQHPVTAAADAVVESSGIGVSEIDVLELHDAAAPAELIQYSQIGLVREGDEHVILRSGQTQLGGSTPVNTSGGLLSRGHAIGATGLAQIVELTAQLRGRAGERQVEDATRAMAVNTGGWFGGDYAVAVATILERA
ncbi:thiolase family protein [Agrococcus baldri]|uniref:Thiolase n=1 Tax=Agrococcus baldri TaxID=153730 RepID=A0AA87RA54_9MICO|nr:thiolase family protein [Agrococcus baldri]GEK79101.1 thiolase [Agrococcus baldri]